MRATTLGISCRCWGSNSDPLAFMASTLPLELSPQLYYQGINRFCTAVSSSQKHMLVCRTNYADINRISGYHHQVFIHHICLLCRLFLKNRTFPLRTVFNCQPLRKVSVVTVLISPVLKRNDYSSVHCGPRHLTF